MYKPRLRMNTRRARVEENPDADQKGWLNLRLGPYGLEGSCSHSAPTTSTTKVYTCSFCKRKFYSSQALGGHQNAHRREREAARKHPAAFHVHHQSMDLLLVTPGGRDGETTSVTSVQPYANSQPASDQQSAHPNTLDLNLKL
ncbi:hypothetical protein L6452_01069 [Arctium lappa]|uniref:Uncharacterized protein n=1 Tax=Arctium lappa TaxID=4217 RepID=A0ACB9FGM4_ARCLA|nr:hypothetical protein L6452_01069 [Arctium lappa]